MGRRLDFGSCGKPGEIPLIRIYETVELRSKT